jgi:hypothetical protein
MRPAASAWTETLLKHIELQVGRDLQYIRINGTLVGGLVGLIIFSVARWLKCRAREIGPSRATGKSTLVTI